MFQLLSLLPLVVFRIVGQKRKNSANVFGVFFLQWSFQILNITLGRSRAVFRQGPVQIVFGIQEKHGFLNGSEVSELLRNLSVVEFSFYLGFPVQQIAEREYLCKAKIVIFLLHFYINISHLSFSKLITNRTA